MITYGDAQRGASTVMSAIALVIACMPFVACDLLSTRDPQPPAQQTNFRTPTTPNIVLENLQAAVNARDAVSYARCFADTAHGTAPYRFIPAADAQLYAVRFSTWGVADETAYFLSLKSQVPAGASMTLFLDSLQTEAGASDSTVYSATYTLVANHTDPTRPTQARGRMHLTVKADPVTQLWAIAQWLDVAVPPDASWSVMKARFSP